MAQYLRDSVSNGNPREQALIRRWWHESEKARGTLVWEYYLEGRYADAILFCGPDVSSREEGGTRVPERFPLAGSEVILCEAKSELTPELIGQALVYARFAIRAGAKLKDTIVFAERSSSSMKELASELGLTVILGPVEEDGFETLPS